MKTIEIGSVLEKEITVTEELLAVHVGSGDVRVYATPMMLALMEGAAAELFARFLDEGETSVGASIASTHLAPTPVGRKVRASVRITGVEGRKVSFAIQAFDESGLIGEGTHERVMVDRARFEAKAQTR